MRGALARCPRPWPGPQAVRGSGAPVLRVSAVPALQGSVRSPRVLELELTLQRVAVQWLAPQVTQASTLQLEEAEERWRMPAVSKKTSAA